MTLHPTVNKIKSILETHGIVYDYFEHEPVKTSHEAAKVRPDQYTLEHGAKALIVKTDKGVFKMLVVPGNRKFDNKKVKIQLGVKAFSFASEEDIKKLTEGIEIGGVPPFGNLFNIEVYVDKEVLYKDRMIFNAGDRKASIGIKTSDYKKCVPITEVSIVSEQTL